MLTEIPSLNGGGDFLDLSLVLGKTLIQHDMEVGEEDKNLSCSCLGHQKHLNASDTHCDIPVNILPSLLGKSWIVGDHKFWLTRANQNMWSPLTLHFDVLQRALAFSFS